MAWGANYGAVGGADASGEYNAFGDDHKLKGHPYQSYSVFMVLGEHTRSPVLSAARQTRDRARSQNYAERRRARQVAAEWRWHEPRRCHQSARL